ncbi:MAG: PspC domain-containing protein [Chitinophagaceae bacterium]|nr:MAG: PspC domain-containing protein [Chitinophagaceae bacterium]
MKQVININFQGRVVPIEVSAFDLLKQYTDSLNRHFANEEGKDEIINDIESRIGELFQDRLKSGSTCITDDDVNAIIKNMGRPEDFEAAEDAGTTTNTQSATEPAPAAMPFQTGRKRLFRNENDKWIGGVCSGLAAYFGVDVIVVRIIFAILFFSFGFGLLPYLILWVAVPSTASAELGGMRKKLYRDTDDKIIAGVCSGIANYFGVNVWIPRVLFLLPFLSFVSRWGHWGDFPLGFTFSPGALIIYIILWLVIPEANTTTEKLEMKGEKVDMNSIKNSVMEEMKGMQQRAEKFGKEASAIAQEKGQAFGADVSHLTKRSRNSFGDIIALLFKIFAYFIIGSALIFLIVALFGFGIVSIGLFPAKDFVLHSGWQNAFAWGTLIFFIAVPIIGIITWIIRRIAKIKSNRKWLRSSFGAMWILGLVCFIALISSVIRDFRSINNINEEQVMLSNPNISKLEITTLNPEKKYNRRQWLQLRPFDALTEDTAFVRNVKVEIVKSLGDSFHVTMLRVSNGYNKTEANMLASKINFSARQLDSALIIDRGIAINKTDKFRNQRVIITIHVPVGKQIRVDESIGWGNDIQIDGPWGDDWRLEMDDVEHGWDRGVTYVMKEDGLYNLKGEPADDWKRDQLRRERGIDIQQDGKRVRINEDGILIEDDADYRYETERHEKAIDSITTKNEREVQRVKDSLQKAKDRIEEEIKKVDEKKTNAAASVVNDDFIMPTYNPLIMALMR